MLLWEKMDNYVRKRIKYYVIKYTLMLFVFWTFFISITVWMNIKEQNENTIDIVAKVARESFNKDLAYRLWATSHGGVYVPTTKKTPPSPWLSHLEDRDIVTTQGKKLTLMNPSYMLKQMMEDYSNLYGIKGRIVGIKYLNPQNKANEWETNSIKEFENGSKEESELLGSGKDETLNLMRPMVMKEGCKKCHGHLGYETGSIRGGVSVSVPLFPYREIEFKNIRSIVASNFIVWLIGVLALYFTSLKIKSQLIRRENDVDELKISALVFENTVNAVLITDINGKILRVNKSFLELTQYSENEILGETPRMIKSHHHDEDFYKKQWNSILTTGIWQGEIWNRKKSGEIFAAKESISTIKDEEGEIKYFLAILHDVTQQKKYENKITNLAHYDILTQLPNRVLFYDRFNQAIKRHKRSDEKLALLFLDLDGFKKVNDTKGHQAGDKLIIEVALRLKNIMRQADTIARIGGDEFTIILEDYKNINNLLITVNKVLLEISREIQIDADKFFVSASIGISVYPNDGEDIHTLIKHADTAMYKSKENGKNRYSFYESSMSKQAEYKVLLETQIKNAIQNEEFIVYYQPKVSGVDNKINQMEALVRWNNKEAGIVSPDKFIPIAEELHIIDKIDMYVLKQACMDTKVLIEAGHKIKVAVNFSGFNITKKGCVEEIEDILNEVGFDANNLELEITETYFINFDKKCIDTLRRIRDLGIKLAIDDFGTGYSSLNILKNLPVQVLKIDKSFISILEDKTSDYQMVKSIIEMAHSLNLEVVAEGVEQKYQYNFLQEHKCDILQGYYISRPLCFEDFEKKLEQFNREN